MRAVYNKDGILVKEQNKILAEQYRFYQELYTSNKEIVFNLKPEDNEQLLNEAQIATLDEPISVDKICKAVELLANNKVPGIDGLNKEFYSHFIEELASLLLDLYQYCYKLGRLNRTARMGLISLFPKKRQRYPNAESLETLDIIEPRLQDLIQADGGKDEKGPPYNHLPWSNGIYAWQAYL